MKKYIKNDYTIIEMTYGFVAIDANGNKYYAGDWCKNGFIFKNLDCDEVDVKYICEYGFNRDNIVFEIDGIEFYEVPIDEQHTMQSLIDDCADYWVDENYQEDIKERGWENITEMAEDLLNELSWEHPTTLLIDWF